MSVTTRAHEMTPWATRHAHVGSQTTSSPYLSEVTYVTRMAQTANNNENVCLWWERTRVYDPSESWQAA